MRPPRPWASDARAVLVWAKGDNFSAGANVQMFLDRDEPAARELIGEFMPAIRQFAEIRVPTVAAVQGLCLAAGLEVALSCDMIWAAEGAQLGLVEAVIGATPFGGGTQRLVARAGAGRAAEAVLTGRPYTAEKMRDWGVVNRVVPARDLHETTHAFARRLAAGPTLAHAATKQMIQLAVDEGVEAADAALRNWARRLWRARTSRTGCGRCSRRAPGRRSSVAASRRARPSARCTRASRS